MQKSTIMVVYSTNRDFDYPSNLKEEVPETPVPEKQRLTVGIDRRQRAGKQVTVVAGFIGKTSDLEDLGKVLKNRCGAGGAVKDGAILIQGDFRDKVVALLQNMGYQAKRSN